MHLKSRISTKVWWLLIIAAWSYTVSFIIDNYWSVNASVQSVQAVLQDDIRDQENKFLRFCDNADRINRLMAGAIEDSDYAYWSDGKGFFFIIQSDTLKQPKAVFWTTSRVIPSFSTISSIASSGFERGKHLWYVWKKKPLRDGFSALLVVPVKQHAGVYKTVGNNPFVSDKISSSLFDVMDISDAKTTVSFRDSQPLFAVAQIGEDTVFSNHPVSLIFIVLAIVLLFIFIYRVSTIIYEQYSLVAGLTTLFILLLSVRLLFAFSHVPIDIHQFKLFNNDFFNVGFLMESPGDMLVSLSFILWFVLFVFVRIADKKVLIQSQHAVGSFVYSIIIGGFLLVVSYVFASLVRLIAKHAAVSFEIADFFSLSSTTIYGFLVIALSFIIYFFVFEIIYSVFPVPIFRYAIFWSVGIMVAGLLMLTISPNLMGDGYFLYALIWVFLFSCILSTRLLRIRLNELFSLSFIFWLAFFAISAGLLLLHENRKKQAEQFQLQSAILKKRHDPNLQLQIQQIKQSVSINFLAARFDDCKNYGIRKRLLDSLMDQFPDSYNDNFIVHYYFYDSLNSPLNASDSMDFDVIEQLASSFPLQNPNEGLFRIEQNLPFMASIQKWVLRNTDQRPLGSVFQIISTKTTIPSTVSMQSVPQLSRWEESRAGLNYDYAIYQDWRLDHHTGDYPFPLYADSTSLKKRQQFTVPAENVNLFWVYLGQRASIAIVKPETVVIDILILFSYLFFGFFICSMLLWFIGVLIRFRFKNPYSFFSQWSIRSTIKGSIIVVTLFSFLILGVSTILYLHADSKKSQRESASQLTQAVKAELESELFINRVNDTSQNQYEKARAILQTISKTNKIDIYFYDLQGDLQLSTNYLPFSTALLSRKMNPAAYHHVHRLFQKQFAHQEQIGDLYFMSYYLPVLDAYRNVIGFLNIPFYSEESSLRQKISGVLVFMFVLLSLVFIISGILSFLISGQIVQSLRVITAKMRSINLSDSNETIRWDKTDEMGELVSEYNKMIKKLEQSAEKIRQSEREEAWQEMAKQVAHEIKNPLTPMKLKLQFLNRAIDNQEDNLIEKTKQTTRMMIEQIDLLNQISGFFSEFANISTAEPDLINAADILKNSVFLHTLPNENTIQLDLATEAAWVFMDKNHLNRIFTNLLINAIQAKHPDRALDIQVRQYVENGFVRTDVIDNGIGIDPNIHHTIFQPNFTTKSSGSGLGLAMCKRMVEQANGFIHFQSEQGEGSRFIVDLPLQSNPTAS